jgi:hypothetical protein
MFNKFFSLNYDVKWPNEDMGGERVGGITLFLAKGEGGRGVPLFSAREIFFAILTILGHKRHNKAQKSHKQAF